MPLTTSSSTGKRVESLAVPGANATRRTGRPAPAAEDADPGRSRARNLAKQMRDAERIAAATAEIAAQAAENTRASTQLREAMQRISAGAIDASGATRQSLQVVTQVEERIRGQQQSADRIDQLCRTLQALLGQTVTEIATLLGNFEAAAGRQDSSVQAISELEEQADEIGDIVKTVAYIADQTSLLALNAAIEAARARQHGKGFAVVADEVHTLAEISERSAQQIRDLIDELRTGARRIAAAVQITSTTVRAEVEKGKEIGSRLEVLSEELNQIKTSAAEVAAAAGQAERGAARAKTRVEEIAAIAEQVSTVSDELAAAVEPGSRSAAQVASSLGQISAGVRGSASKVEEAMTAVGSIGTAAETALQRANAAITRSEPLASVFEQTRRGIGQLIEAVGAASTGAVDNVRKIVELEQVSRRIDKIVGAIANVSIQTSMLAVNGSVESARAGEFGKGFALVSTDIRNLARDSTENAEQLKDLVKSVQDRIAQVRRDLEEAGRQALVEIEPARGAARRLAKVATELDQVRVGNVEVRDAAKEIASALGVVRSGLAQISAAVSQAEELSGQAFAAASQQAQGAEDFAAAVEEISGLADELQNG